MGAYETLVAWIMSLMMAWASPAKLFPNDIIQQQNHAATYDSKARDAIAVIYEDENKPMFGGRWARATDLALVMRISAGEHKYIEKAGGFPEVHGGRSWCLMSLNIGKGKTVEGWTGPELDADRKKCFKAGHNAMKRSFGACRKFPFKFGLSVYNSGTCNDQDFTSVSRINEATWRVNRTVPADEDVMKNIESMKNTPADHDSKN